MMGIHIKPKLYGLTILELVEKQTGKINFGGYNSIKNVHSNINLADNN